MAESRGSAAGYLMTTHLRCRLSAGIDDSDFDESGAGSVMHDGSPVYEVGLPTASRGNSRRSVNQPRILYLGFDVIQGFDRVAEQPRSSVE